MTKQFRATLVRPRGWGGNPYATRYERHETVHAEPVEYRGVYERREIGKPIRYRVCISVKDVTHHLGTFDDALEAAIAYDKAARQYHGAKAVLNFPLPARPERLPGMVRADRGGGVDGAGLERAGRVPTGDGR